MKGLPVLRMQEEDFNALVTGLPLEQGSTGNGKDPSPDVVPHLTKAKAAAEALAKAQDTGDADTQAAYDTIAKHMEFRQHLIQVR